MSNRHLFTSESVTEGHPDKISDQVSDAVLDTLLAEDEMSRVACETMVTTGMVIVAGEITSEAQIDIPEVVRETVKGIGYDDATFGFDYRTCAVLTSLDRQSPDIGQGVDTGGAGDQGMMFGFASRETDTFMPLPITLANRLTRRLAECRREGILPWLRPDGKSQVTVEYEDNTPTRVHTVVVSSQHDDGVSNDEVRDGIIEHVVWPVLPPDLHDPKTIICHINPTGRFVIGGPQGDCGLTGRKIIVDTYGGVGSHGGGAFSGKDPSKVDRSASYAARWVAKNLVAADLATRAELQIAYAIGVAEPVSVAVQTNGTGVIDDVALVEVVNKVFDLRPAAIIESLGLRRPIFKRTAAYGHFGRQPDEDGGFSWEKLDRVEELKAAADKHRAQLSGV